MNFRKQLKKHNPKLYQIHKWILKVEKEGWGRIEFDVKCHDYVSTMIEMKAVDPEKKTLPKSMTKKVMSKKHDKKVV